MGNPKENLILVFEVQHNMYFESCFFSIFLGQHDIPPCVRNVIMHQIKSPRPKKSNATKMIKKLSKTITLPEDPNDPTAFTLHLDQYDHYSLMRRQQKKNTTGTSSNLVKIVGSFSIFMTIAIVITVLCFLCKSLMFFLCTQTAAAAADTQISLLIFEIKKTNLSSFFLLFSDWSDTFKPMTMM